MFLATEEDTHRLSWVPLLYSGSQEGMEREEWWGEGQREGRGDARKGGNGISADGVVMVDAYIGTEGGRREGMGEWNNC